jgi:hypothetical protein
MVNALQNNEISTVSGNLLLNSTGGKINIASGVGLEGGSTRFTGSIQSATLNATTSVNTPSVASSGAISIKASGDTDDYLTFETVGNVPMIKATGVNAVYVTSDVARSNTDSQVIIKNTNEFSGLELNGAGGALGYIYQYNEY